MLPKTTPPGSTTESGRATSAAGRGTTMSLPVVISRPPPKNLFPIITVSVPENSIRYVPGCRSAIEYLPSPSVRAPATGLPPALDGQPVQPCRCAHDR